MRRKKWRYYPDAERKYIIISRMPQQEPCDIGAPRGPAGGGARPGPGTSPGPATGPDPGGCGQPAPTDPETEQAVRLRVGRRLHELSVRLDAPSYALLLKMLRGINAAFASPDGAVELELTAHEQALCTEELRDELLALLELSHLPHSSVRLGG